MARTRSNISEMEEITRKISPWRDVIGHGNGTGSSLTSWRRTGRVVTERGVALTFGEDPGYTRRRCTV